MFRIFIRAFVSALWYQEIMKVPLNKETALESVHVLTVNYKTHMKLFKMSVTAYFTLKVCFKTKLKAIATVRHLVETSVNNKFSFSYPYNYATIIASTLI